MQIRSINGGTSFRFHLLVVRRASRDEMCDFSRLLFNGQMSALGQWQPNGDINLKSA